MYVDHAVKQTALGPIADNVLLQASKPSECFRPAFLVSPGSRPDPQTIVQTEEAIDDWLDSAWLATTSAVYDATT
jgi:hypothetical protein